MPDPTTEPTEAAIPAPKREQCRAITTSGHRCKKGATYNGHLCYPHAHHRNPVLPDPTHVAIPLLEDHASVQLVLSQIAHGLLTHKLDTDRARALIYACQVASATMPRPPRLPSPHPTPGNPLHQESAEGGSASDGESVYRLALDYEGLICGDGDLPAPSAYWQPPSPEATPWDLIHAAPNQSKPTPDSPSDPDTHQGCAICNEIRSMQSKPYMHPHLQPTVNPYCKWNQSGCQGPASANRCIACDGVYWADPRRFDRTRRRRHHPETSEGPHHGRTLADIGSEEPEPQLLPNPIPEQFPDNDPMIHSRVLLDADLDLKAEADSSAPGRFQGNTQNLLPSKPFAMKETTHPEPGGSPHRSFFKQEKQAGNHPAPSYRLQATSYKRSAPSACGAWASSPISPASRSRCARVPGATGTIGSR